MTIPSKPTYWDTKWPNLSKKLLGISLRNYGWLLGIICNLAAVATSDNTLYHDYSKWFALAGILILFVVIGWERAGTSKSS